MVPVSVAENITYAIDLPYPPSSPLVLTEYTITPPPPFSLNDLLNGNITTLLGVVFNGSFDTSYEREAMAIAEFYVHQLTTAVYLNESDAIENFAEMRYYSYPRNLTSVTSVQTPPLHFYLSHTIHSAPDFDQVIHASIDLSTCACTGSVCGNSANWIAKVQTPGVEW